MQCSVLTSADDNAPRFIRASSCAHDLARMISSDLPSPAEAGFAKVETGFHPRIASGGRLFPDHA
jgi:hypothetical protein